MAYISGGQVISQRSPYRASLIVEWFWAFLNMLALFFSTVFGDAKNAKVKKTDSYLGGNANFKYGGGGGPRGKNIKGFSDISKGGAACAPAGG